MKKKILAILSVLMLLMGVLGLGSAVSASNDIGNLKVGYAALRIEPIDKEGTFRKIDYTSILQGSGNATLKAELAAAGVTLENPYYTVPTLQVDCDNDGNKDDGYFSMPLAGYGSTDTRLSTGMLDDNGDGVIDGKDGSFVTCIAVTDQNGHTMLFFSLDLISSSAFSSFSVRDGIRKDLLAKDASYKVPASSMMFSASHTHSSPDDGINNAYALPINAAQRAYRALVRAKVLEAAIAAMQDRSEVTVSAGEIQADNMNATRHYSATEIKSNRFTGKEEAKASWVHGDNFGASLPSDEKLEAGTVTEILNKYTYTAANVSQSNETLQLVQFTHKNGEDPIVMVNFRAHPKLTSSSAMNYGGDNRLSSSPDYVGMLREKLQYHGYRASYIQGASGNQNTWNYLDDTLLTPGIQNTTPSTAMYNEIIAYREPDGSSLTTYNDTLSFIKYTAVDGTVRNAQTGYSYGARLADYALKALKNNMVSQDNGVIKASQTVYTGQPQLFSEGLIAAATAYRNAGSEAYGYLYQHTDGKYYNINSKYQASTVYGRRNGTVDSVDCKLTLNCITIGPLAFVSAPNELYDRYNASGDQVNNNLWDAFNAAANKAGYITPVVLGYTNGSEGYIPNVAAYEYNRANNDAGTVTRPSNGKSMIMGTGAYEANTTKFAPGSGEQILAQLQNALLSVEENQRPATCPMCGEENVQWDPLTEHGNLSIYGGHYYLEDDLVGYAGTAAAQRLIYANTCIDLNGHTAGNSATNIGRAFYVVGGKTLRVMNGTLRGRGSNTDASGGVIYTEKNASVYLTDVDVIRETHNGQTAAYGGAIYLNDSAKLYMKNGTVSGGATTSGGCIYAYLNATVDLDSVTLINGSATDKGDAICSWSSKVHIYGDSVIKGESCFLGGGATTKFSGNVQAFESPDGVNIRLTDNTRLTFGTLSETAKISVQGNAWITDATGVGYVGKQLVADNGFFLDNSFTTKGVFAGDKQMCECGGTATQKHTCQVHAYAPWTATDSLPTSGNYYLTDNVVTSAQTVTDTTGKTLRIDLAGNSITHKVTTANANATRVFSMAANTELVLSDTVGTGTLRRDLSNLSASQLSAITNYGVGVCLINGCTFRMYGGSFDMQGQSTTGGGVIAGTVANSTIEIYGGTISGLTAGSGGGLYSKGLIKLLGGNVTGNYATNGAGVYLTESAAKLTLSGDANVTGNYKKNSTTESNIPASASKLTISGTYTGTAGITVTSPKNGTVVAISDNADISGATLYVDGNSKFRFKVSEGSVSLVDSTKILAKDSDGNTYTSMAEALNACASSGASLMLVNEVAEDITVTKDIAIDLAGFYISGEVSYTNGAKVILSDSTTDDYVCGDEYGMMPYSTNVVAADGYLLCEEDGAVSAHAYEVKLTSVAQRARVVGMYFGSSFKGDEVVKRMVSEFGVSLRVNKAPDASYILADTACKTHTRRLRSDWVTGTYQGDFYGTVLENVMSLSNTDFTNNRNANLPIFGVSYIKLANGDFLFGNTYSCTLKQLTELSDSMTLTETQMSTLLQMYQKYPSVMGAWNIPQIKAAYRQTVGTKATFADLYSDLKILGRTPVDGTGISTAWPGTGFSMNIRSDGSPMKLGVSTGTTSVYYCIEVDGVQVDRPKMLGTMEYTLTVPAGEHTITVFRDSANTPNVSCKLEYLDFVGEVLDKPGNKDLYIEVLGDSIASGLGSLGTYTEGVDWINEEHSVSNSFGWYVAKDFNADISVLAKGGIGAVTTALGKDMSQIYPYVNGYTGTTPYDFARKPDLVIVELGANDGAKTDAEYTAGLTRVYQQIFDRYGKDVKILWVGKNERFYNIANNMSATVGGSCYAVLHKYGVSGSGPSIAAAAHPNAAEHRAFADDITAYIRSKGLLG